MSVSRIIQNRMKYLAFLLLFFSLTSFTSFSSFAQEFQSDMLPSANVLTAEQVQQALSQNVLILDTRPKEVVAAGFVPGSLHLEAGDAFSRFLPLLIDEHEPYIIIAEEEKVDDLLAQLEELGRREIRGVVWDQAILPAPLEQSALISFEDLKTLLETPANAPGNAAEMQFIDMRTHSEYAEGHIPYFDNIPLQELEERAENIRRDQPVVIHCRSGVRAATAYSILRRMGFDQILNYSGGTNDWTGRGEELTIQPM